MRDLKIVLPIMLVATLLISSCSEENLNNDISGTGNIISKSQSLDPFTEIEVRNYCNVEVVAGSENRVEYSDYENIVAYLVFEVENDRLIIKTIPESTTVHHSKAKAKLYLSGNLHSLFVKGSGNIDLISPFEGVNNFSIAGSGNINAHSSLDSANITCVISGSGNMDLLQIHSANATGIISGSGNIMVAVSTNLNGSITGSGNIYYQGNPAVVKNISGSGNVIQL